MRGTTWKLVGVAVSIAVVAVLIGLYVSTLTNSAASPSYSVPVQSSNGHPVVNLTIETVAAVGPELSPSDPDFVSYLIRNAQGKWIRSTVWKLPANATVHVTIYNFDGNSGLRNPYLARPTGIDGNAEVIDGTPTTAINPDDASHTFAVPAYHLIVPLPGVADNAKNQCGYAPCALTMAHRTVTFTFHTGAAGHYRWQCFVPCAAGWLYGFGGPMQTIGYMDGFLDVI